MASTPQHSRLTWAHDWIQRHEHMKPIKLSDFHGKDINGRIALILTDSVGTMWCAYAFAILALISLPGVIQTGDPKQIVAWIAQTFLQLVLLSVIMVGQNIMGAASDARAEHTYNDAEATFQLARQIQNHLQEQDDHLAAQDQQLQSIIAALKDSFPNLKVDGGTAPA